MFHANRKKLFKVRKIQGIVPGYYGQFFTTYAKGPSIKDVGTIFQFFDPLPFLLADFFTFVH